MFEDADQAKAYRSFRPSPPSEIIERIINYVTEKFPGSLDHAVDVGCGTGQSTNVLAPYFRNVTGCDISEAQIEEAFLTRRHDNVNYKVATAEELPFPDSSVTLVTACTCLHWFDHEKFFRELDRVLVPGGVLAVYGATVFRATSADPEKDEQFARLNKEVYKETLKIYESPRVQMFFNKYEDLHFPLVDIKRESGIPVLFEGTGAQMAGYTQSVSHFQKLKEKNPEKATELISYINQRMKDILGINGNLEDVCQKFKHEYFIILGSKSSEKTEKV